ncbi:Fe-S oxidoreductase [Cupriavidus pinatubonensis]|uniref:Glycosyl transferase, family 2 n=2 Tax=Burkholderiaceae TaxID=119060 RepID=Q46RI6_CUPPJ|nr:Fe-S oxidoreductase [Cupriavidus pinatubonensis]
MPAEAAAMAATLLGSALTCVSAGYAVAAAVLTRRAGARAPAAAAAGEVRASVLKPLCGAEPRLYDNLATLCRQSVTGYQVVCGVRDPDDPAIAVVRRLQQDFPDIDITLVIDPRVHGSNLKVSNLINLAAHARHDLLVVADSDIAVPPDYLARVAAPLADPGVGIVTCLYRGRPVDAFWAKLGAQFIDDWFAPSVRIAHAGGSRRFAFGATIALRRDTLTQIGGFASLSDRLADDFWLGELTRQAGLRTVLSDVVVTTDVTETRLPELWTHELRWLRTIRSLNPAGFAFTFITFTWPMLVVGVVLSPAEWTTAIAVAGALARSAMARTPTTALRAPLRDTLLLIGWAAALGGQRVRWRQQVLSVQDPA